MVEQSPAAPDANLSKRIRRYSIILAVVALILAVWGETSRVLARGELKKESADAAVATVITVRAKNSAAGEELVLPGSVQAFIEAPIYARTNGYLKDWKTDIGTPVTKGELLAEIETPEVDRQLNQAQADLETARANQALANTTNERWKTLLATESVSKQDAEEKAGDAAAKKAMSDSAAANLARLHELESFKRVVAPFDGAQHRCRRADQRRPEHRQRIISCGRHAQAADLRASPGGLCGGNHAGPARGTALRRASGEDLRGENGAHRQRPRSEPAHSAGGARAR